MAKKKHTSEWMLTRIEEYLNGEGSYGSISHANGIGKTTLKRWVCKYREYGAEAFATHTENAHYSKEFKAVEDYIHFYNYERFQERFGTRTPMEVRTAALAAVTSAQYPIAENKRIQKYTAQFAA